MEEKVMGADTLASVNSNLSGLASMIVQTENKELRQTLKQIRNGAEMSQEELYNIAKSKSYHIPARMATETDIEQVKSIFTN